MILLGLRLAWAGSRQSRGRLFVTIVGIAISALLMLSILSAYNAAGRQEWRTAWMTTRGERIRHEGDVSLSPEFINSKFYWHAQEDSFGKRAIQTFWIGGNVQKIAPPPGLRKWPRPGEFFLSPALAHLSRTAPTDQLSKRFGTKFTGILGSEGLGSPKQLVAIVGTTGEKLQEAGRTYSISAVQSKPDERGSRYWFISAIGMLSILFPLMVFVGTSCTLGVTQREKILAALRLIGATRFQVGIFSSVESIGSAVLGFCLGTLLFKAVRAQMSNVFFGRDYFFLEDFNVNSQQVGLTFICIAAITVLSTMRTTIRVGLSPLGIARQVSGLSLSLWRAFPIIAGAFTLAFAASLGNGGIGKSTTQVEILSTLGFILVFWGIIAIGPLLTRWSGQLIASRASGAAILTAARRIEQDSVAIFRSVSGVVVAVFIATLFHTALSGAIKSLDNERQTAVTLPLKTVTAQLIPPLKPDEVQSLLRQLSSSTAAEKAIPIYTFSSSRMTERSVYWIMRSDVAKLGVGRVVGSGPIVAFPFTELAWGKRAKSDWNAFSPKSEDFAKAKEDMKVERIIIPAPHISQKGTTERVERAKSEILHLLGPRANLEVIEKVEETAKFGIVDNIVQLGRAALLFSMLIASCNMAVSAVGRMIERRHAFGLLRLSGMPVQSLLSIVLLEAIIPLLIVIALALGMGAFVTKMIFLATAKVNIPLGMPPASFWWTLFGGVALSMGIAAALLPLTLQMTKDQVRRE